MPADPRCGDGTVLDTTRGSFTRNPWTFPLIVSSPFFTLTLSEIAAAQRDSLAGHSLRDDNLEATRHSPELHPSLKTGARGSSFTQNQF